MSHKKSTFQTAKHKECACSLCGSHMPEKPRGLSTPDFPHGIAVGWFANKSTVCESDGSYDIGYTFICYKCRKEKLMIAGEAIAQVADDGSEIAKMVNKTRS